MSERRGRMPGHVLDNVARWAARRPRHAVVIVTVSIVAFAYAEALFFGGTLVPTDLVDRYANPFSADRPFGFEADKASGDLVNIHAHWTMVGRSFRDMSGWWDRSVGLGYPVMKGGFPVFAVPYLVLPAWFAPGVMTALRTLAAWGLTHGWMRSLGVRRVSALVAGATFAFSGFMVGWGGWPHASVAAVAPGLLWGVERLLVDPCARRGVPIGVLVAVMVWANFPLVAAYVLFGVAAYALVRLVHEHRGAVLRAGVKLTPAAVVAAVVGVGLSYPHLRFFPAWLDWADTSHRSFGVDSSAGSEFLLTTVLPGAFGTDGHGPAWWAYGNWVEFEIHVGLPVLLVSGFAWAAARGDDLEAVRRRGAVLGLWLLVVLGVLIGYVGGPPTLAAQELLGDLSGLATRAKVLISLGFAGLAGFGFEAWIDDRPAAAAARRRLMRPLLALSGIVGVLMLPAVWRWLDDMQVLGHRRTTLVAAWPVVVLGAAAVVLLVARSRGRLGSWSFTAAFGTVLIAELLAFAMPIPTVVSRSERLTATPAHAEVAALLEPGERLAGHGTTFYPSTTQIFEIEALGGQTLKSAGYQALVGTVFPNAFRTEGGGTPTYPALQPEVDPTLSVWDALGVGVWSLDPFTAPPGPQTELVEAPLLADATASDLVGSVVVPEGGLRAVIIDALINRADGRLHVAVEVGAELIETSIRRDEGWIDVRHPVVIAIAGEHLPSGATATITVRGSGASGGLGVGVTDDGELVVATVGWADDGLRVVSTGPVTILERLDAAAFRLHDAAIVEPDLGAAAAAVVARASIEGAAAIVSESVGLPAEADPNARLEIVATTVTPDTATATVRTDRRALVVFPVPDYPGWSAVIDGAPADVIQADTTLAAVVVPPGDHVVELRFQPDGVDQAIAVFVITAFAALALWFTPRSRRLKAISTGRIAAAVKPSR